MKVFRLLTAAETSALAVFELRGALDSLEPRLRSSRGAPLRAVTLRRDKPRRVQLWSADGEPVDDALLLRRGPAHWELHCHGGIALLRGVRRLLEAAGWRPQAPAADDFAAELEQLLAGCGSRYALRAALWQRQAWSAIEAELQSATPAARRAAVGKLRARRRWAQALWGRPRLVLLGAPNAGKSTLYNRLLQAERAIVSAQPGTTRDLLRAHAVVGPLELELQDGAGLRSTPDSLEALGIERVLDSLRGASACLHVLDGEGDLEAAWQTLHKPLWERCRLPALVVASKADRVKERKRLAVPQPGGLLWISAEQGWGLRRLSRAVARLFGFHPCPSAALPWSARQQTCLRVASSCLARGNAQAWPGPGVC